MPLPTVCLNHTFARCGDITRDNFTTCSLLNLVPLERFDAMRVSDSPVNFPWIDGRGEFKRERLSIIRPSSGSTAGRAPSESVE